MKCPICNKLVDPNSKDAAPPFCSERCQMIDAKRWLNEEYSIVSVNLDELERQIAEVDSSDDGISDNL